MKVQTEIGEVWIEASYWYEEHAVMDGYEYWFTSKEIGRDVYRKVTDDGKETYAIID